MGFASGRIYLSPTSNFPRVIFEQAAALLSPQPGALQSVRHLQNKLLANTRV